MKIKTKQVTSWDNSKYWLGDHLKSSEDTIDVLQLAGVKRSIGNFVRIVTGKDIPVRFSTGNDSYTDGTTVTIAGKISDKQFDSTVGLALHEGSHIAFTDFSVLRKLQYNGLPNVITTHLQYVKSLLNIIEDRRIDYIVYTSAPGYREYYKSMYNEYFNNPIVDKALLNNWKNKETWDDYLFHICNFTNPNRNVKALRNLEKIWNVFDLRNIGRLQSTEDALNVAVEIYQLIKEAVDLAAASSTGTAKSPSDQTPKGKSSDKSESNDKSDDKSNDKSESNDKSDDKSTDESEGDSSYDDVDTSADVSVDEDPDNFDIPPSTPMSSSDYDKLQKALQEQSKFIDGEVKKSKIAKAKADQADALANDTVDIETVGKDLDTVIDNAYGRLYRKGATNTKCIVINKLTRNTINSLNIAVTDPDRIRHYLSYKLDFEAIDSGYRMGAQLANRLKLRSESVELKSTRLPAGKIDKRLLSGLGFGLEAVFEKTNIQTVNPVTIHYSIDASGSMSGAKGRTALKSVAAICRAVRDIPNVNIVVTLRSCMTSGSNIYPALITLYDSRQDSWSHLQTWLPCVSFSSSTPEGLCFEALEKSLLNTGTGSEAIFINISDGEPAFNNKDLRYFGQVAFKHTRDQVKRIQNKGFKIMSYFVADGLSGMAMKNFKYMYGESAQFTDVNNLNNLARTLNQILLKPAYAIR